MMKLEKFKSQNKQSKYIITLSIISIFLLAFIFFATSFAIFEDIKNFNIIEGNIIDPKDIMIISYLDNNYVENIPSKSNNTILNFSKSTCTNGANIEWNEELWKANIKNVTQKRTKCNLYFESVYSDATGAHTPELHQGMIPIKFDGTTMKVADVKTDSWYDYATHAWANAALIKYSDTTIRNKYFNSDGSVKTNVIVDVNDLLQMYVWIPRYRYKLWNATMGTSQPQAIEIEFESKDKTKQYGSTNGEWLTHPAFTFGETELNGIWVGKFEMTGTEAQPTILPNQVSLTNLNVSQMFYSLYNMSSTTYGINKATTDTHMMKNMEWGAVAYLSHSIYGRYQNSTTCISSGCEVWINNVNTSQGMHNGSSITGCAGNSKNAEENPNKTACDLGYTWNELGINASTTGNIYGIYDMSGGIWEYVMGVMLDQNSTHPIYGESGFTEATMPTSKYYNDYTYFNINQTDIQENDLIKQYHLGEATRETITSKNTNNNSWYGDTSVKIRDNFPWIVRGGYSTYAQSSGIFSYHYSNAGIGISHGSRAVLSRN